MTAEDKLKNCDLDGALADLQDAVRKDPADAKLRIFLFQLLSVLGQWKRALTQLAVAGDLDAKALPMVQTYREAIQCESLRAQAFAGKTTPLIFGEPEEWIALLLEALKVGAGGNHEAASDLRDRAFEAAPTTSGRLDGKPFEWIADADMRLGPVLEIVVNGRYYWVPFHRISKIEIEEPADLRDKVWTPVYLTWANGGAAVGLIPTRYPGSEEDTDSAVRLARKTYWQECPGETYQGLGQRLLATDEGEFPLMDLRNIELDVAVEETG
jgi:type VI secretion system protein ImpE